MFKRVQHYFVINYDYNSNFFVCSFYLLNTCVTTKMEPLNVAYLSRPVSVVPVYILLILNEIKNQLKVNCKPNRVVVLRPTNVKIKMFKERRLLKRILMRGPNILGHFFKKFLQKKYIFPDRNPLSSSINF